jgi:hypothetical protein
LSDEASFEVEQLERAAAWRLRKVDADPADQQSRAAAAHLEMLAEDMWRLRGSVSFREYMAICNWLGESGEIADFTDMANDYRARVGIDHWPQDSEAYLRALIALAKQTFGA